MKKKKDTQEISELANHEIVVIAAYLVGADSNSADTEDIAVKASQLVPGRFTWRKYKEQINIDTVRKRLWDAAKSEKGSYLIGSEKTGWRLTKAGFDFAKGFPVQNKKKNASKGKVSTRESQTERTAKTREIKRMLAEHAFKKIQEGKATTLTKSDAERFFRLDDYVTGKARAAKIERFKIMAQGQPELSEAIDSLKKLLEKS